MNTRKKLITITVVVSLVALAFIGGTFYGFKKGYENRYLFDAAQDAELIASELTILRRGDTEKIIEYQESNLDYFTWLHGEYLTKGNPSMIYLYLKLFETFPQEINANEFMRYKQNMGTVVKYRKEHPIYWSLETVCPDPANCPEEKKEHCKKRREVIEKTLQRYGWRP